MIKKNGPFYVAWVLGYKKNIENIAKGPKSSVHLFK